MNDELKGAFRPLHLDGLTFHAGGDARGDGDRLFSDA